jgi:isopenicillin-N N-acyltransferase-like protein
LPPLPVIPGTKWIQIGQQHGGVAAKEIDRGIRFYQAYFQEKSKLDWESAKAAAQKFLPLLIGKCPHLVEEMKGMDYIFESGLE